MIYAVMDSKGIPYYTDMSCMDRFKKYHKEGFRNIYTVKIRYVLDGQKTQIKTITLNYSKYRLAFDRYTIETSTKYYPSLWILENIAISVQTYDGVKLVHEDVLMDVGFNHISSNGHRLGEVNV